MQQLIIHRKTDNQTQRISVQEENLPNMQLYQEIMQDM